MESRQQLFLWFDIIFRTQPYSPVGMWLLLDSTLCFNWARRQFCYKKKKKNASSTILWPIKAQPNFEVTSIICKLYPLTSTALFTCCLECVPSSADDYVRVDGLLCLVQSGHKCPLLCHTLLHDIPPYWRKEWDSISREKTRLWPENRK